MPARPQHIARLTGLVFLAFLLGACGPVFSRYHYVSLDEYTDAKMVERARVDPGATSFFIGKIPVRYEIERPEYTLTLEIPRRTPGLELKVVVEPWEKRTLHFPGLGQETYSPCVNRNGDNLFTPLGWTYRGVCRREEDGYFIRFSVLDRDGNVVGEEAIPYEIRTPGFFIYLDGI